MKKSEMKDRITKADDRALVLMKKYPFVFGLVVLVGIVVGFIAGKVF